jgi:GTP cyclohydrolase FolE2
MLSNVNFAQLLRPVGQMLEPLQLESFSLKIEEGNVSVQAQKREEQRSQRAAQVSLRVTWQLFRRKPSASTPEPQPSSGLLELHYTRDDIARMEMEAQSRRQAAGGRPEAHALSQVLRAVGAFVDQKQGRLTSVKMAGQDITIEYESPLKQNLTEKFTVATLYDYWVKMYLKRRQRS